MIKKMTRLIYLSLIFLASASQAENYFCTTTQSKTRVCSDAEKAVFEEKNTRPSDRLCFDSSKSFIKFSNDINGNSGSIEKDKFESCAQMLFTDTSFNAVYSNTCRFYKSKIYAPDIQAFVNKSEAPNRREINVDWRREQKSDFTSTPQWMIPPGETAQSTFIKFEQFETQKNDKSLGRIEIYQLQFTGEKEHDHILAMEILEDKSTLLSRASGECFAAADETHAKNLLAQKEKQLKETEAAEAKEAALQQKYANAPSCQEMIGKLPKGKQMMAMSSVASGNPPEPCKKCSGPPSASSCSILIPQKLRK